MVPEKQWRDKGEMMDKRTARKVNGDSFQKSIASIIKQYQTSENQEPEDSNAAVNVYIRKRPILIQELKAKDFDVITTVGQRGIAVMDCQMHSDMKQMFIETSQRSFSHCFDESQPTEYVYQYTTKSLVQHTLQGGKAVVMMYGQTGSGKSYTMSGFQELIAMDLFSQLKTQHSISVAVIEIIGSGIYDLMSNHRKIALCEDKDRNQLVGLQRCHVKNATAFMDIIRDANGERATQSTAVNSVSSRSHCAYIITLNDAKGNVYGELTLLDLAGSERNEDSFHHSADRRKETSAINTSHMALKQCVRAMIEKKRKSGPTHIPYRGSTLTRILKDSLWAEDSKAAIIATVSPISKDTEHTLHTLEYAGLMLEENPVVIKTKVDVKSPKLIERRVTPIKDWDHEKFRQWFCKLQRTKFSKYEKNLKSSMDGRQISRFGIARFTQLCDNNTADGQYAYNALLNLKEKIGKIEADRKKQNAMLAKGRK